MVFETKRMQSLTYYFAVRLGHCQRNTERTRWSKAEISSRSGIYYCYV